jgi:hypothetical protein
MTHVITSRQENRVYRVEATQMGYIGWVEASDGRVLFCRRFNNRGPDKAYHTIGDAYHALKLWLESHGSNEFSRKTS